MNDNFWTWAKFAYMVLILAYAFAFDYKNGGDWTDFIFWPVTALIFFSIGRDVWSCKK